MRVLVTGASGFLGSHIAELLVERGHHVRALVRPTSNTTFLKGLGVELAQGAVDQEAPLDPVVQGIDAIVHSAGLVKARGAEEFFRVNTAGTQALVDAAKRAAPTLKRFVLVSSLAAHGPSPDGTPRPIDSIPNPVTHYGRSKLAAERIVLAEKDRFPVTVVRPGAIYGPRDAEIFAFFKSVARRVVPLIGDGTNKVSMIYGRDCATAVSTILERDTATGKVYFLDDGTILTWNEMGAILEEALKVRAMRLKLPVGLFRGVALFSETYGKMRGVPVMLTRDKINELQERYWVCSSAEIRRDLNWVPEVDFSKGAALTVNWYQSQGWL